MYSRFLSLLLLILVIPMFAGARVLRVCADPDNLPFSNQRGEGFENRLAELMARELGATLEYTWWSERRSFVRNTLDADRCEVVMGAPAALDSVTASQPYYRSTYVLVSRRDRDLRITSLFDARLDHLRIGVHLVGDGYAPPAYLLARRGLSANIQGYSLFGPLGEENPPARLLSAVAAGDIDIAIVWGPFAGYFAPRQKAELEISPISPAMYLGVPFAYEISMGVRKGNTLLKSDLDRALQHSCAAVQAILKDYGVPQVSEGEGKEVCASSSQLPSASAR